ncbi:hypothetical protein [Streptomyces albogriseolus]|uniref:hypothetical protein n=1 Tax=Streptomyces albogriseolus TaxID=1887 RepID=UPI003702786B
MGLRLPAYETLADYFDSVAVDLTRIADGGHPRGRLPEGRIVWLSPCPCRPERVPRSWTRTAYCPAGR